MLRTFVTVHQKVLVDDRLCEPHGEGNQQHLRIRHHTHTQLERTTLRVVTSGRTLGLSMKNRAVSELIVTFRDQLNTTPWPAGIFSWRRKTSE